MSLFIWVWFAISIGSMFYVLFQVNIGKKMTSREIAFFCFGMFVMGVPFIYSLSQ